jgi:DNA helicase-2/ATP-dependent DNA helicase PcrA
VQSSEILHDLNEDQRRAVEAVRGPVCILAGAGSGKTTTITRRIANQVSSGAFEPSSILAVTFTDRAAGEMRERLEELGVKGVRASTFHSAALAQLRDFAQNPPADILPSKTIALRKLANNLPKPYNFRPAADLATEIEWAKNRRIPASGYLASLTGHEPPIPADLMASIYKRYEAGKVERNLIDFEDLLELAIQMFQSDPFAREQMHARYGAFTVDEYQDVNLLQETLLREWVGERDDLCVVGDDYQSIYGFTGAAPSYLLEMPGRFAGTQVFRLETNYRSTPQILAIANRLVPNLGGAEKVLKAKRRKGPEVEIRTFSVPASELRFIVDRIRTLIKSKVKLEDIAILYRVNFRSEDYEEILAAEGIPYQVADGAFLSRVTGRQMVKVMKNSRSTSVAADVLKHAERAGYIEDPPDDLGEQELTRQNDLARFVKMAQEFDNGARTGAEFAADVEQRFGGGGQGRGVNLLTYHRAKGLEFEAVILPKIEDGEMPFRRARSPEAIAEERRLFYVGLTRAKTHLAITCVGGTRRKISTFFKELRDEKVQGVGSPLTQRLPSRGEFVAELGLEIELPGGFTGKIVELGDDEATIEVPGGSQLGVAYGHTVIHAGEPGALAPPISARGMDLLDELKRWRLERSKADEVPAYVVFHDSTLAAIAEVQPTSLEELAGVPGIGPAKLDRYGQEILGLVGSFSTSA